MEEGEAQGAAGFHTGTVPEPEANRARDDLRERSEIPDSLFRSQRVRTRAWAKSISRRWRRDAGVLDAGCFQQHERQHFGNPASGAAVRPAFASYNRRRDGGTLTHVAAVPPSSATLVVLSAMHRIYFREGPVSVSPPGMLRTAVAELQIQIEVNYAGDQTFTSNLQRQ